MAIDTGTALIICMGLLSLIVVFLSMFIFGLYSKSIPIKIFSLGLSTLLMLVILGVNLSLLQNEITGFTNFSSTFSDLYTVTIYLIGAGMVGLIVYLIYNSLTLFNKSRGRIPED